MKTMQNGKRSACRWLLVALLVGGPVVSGQAFTDSERQALRLVMDDVEESLEAAQGRFGDRNLSVLPLAGDENGYVEGLLKGAVTGTGLRYVEGGQSAFWDSLLEEMAWNERKGDLLDPATLTAFGQLQGTQVLLYGTVREARAGDSGTFVELELHAASIATKEHLWGESFARRLYMGEAVEGIVDLRPEVREVLRLAFVGQAENLKGVEALQGAPRVAMTRLAGDVDGYATSLAEALLTEAGLQPVRLPGRSAADVLASVRGAPQGADAVLFGAVRDLSRVKENENFLSTDYEMNAEVQLRIQEAGTGAVLWSRAMGATSEERESLSGLEAVRRYQTPLLIGVAVLLGLVVVGKLFGAMQRPR